MEDPIDAVLLARFENHDELVDLQNSLLKLDLGVEPSPDEARSEVNLMNKISMIVCAKLFLPFIYQHIRSPYSSMGSKNNHICLTHF